MKQQIPDWIKRFVEQSGYSIARRKKTDILKCISFKDFRTLVQSRGYHLLEVKNEFLIIRDDYLRFVC